MEEKKEDSVFIKLLKIKSHFLFSSCEINFSEPNGEIGNGINYIVGESGSGKTRLLELITGKFLSKRNINGTPIQSIPLSYYKESLTEADFELQTKSGIEIIDTNEIRKVPTSGKFTYTANPHVTVKGSIVDYKRQGKNGQEYLITKDSLGTGEFSFDYLQGIFKKWIGISDKIIVIEEPEYGKDPITQQALMKIIGNVAKTNQVFITTHSPTIINWNHVKFGASIIKLSRTNNETIIGQHKGNIPEFLIKTTKAHLGGTESKSFLFSNKVCIVEGQEDVGYLQIYFSSDLQDGSFSNPDFVFFGYGSNGQGDINNVLTICSNLKIPKVAAIYDGDLSTKESFDEAIKNPDYISLKYKIVRLLAPDIRTKQQDGVFKKSDGSNIEFSDNEYYKKDFETNIQNIFEYFK